MFNIKLILKNQGKDKTFSERPGYYLTTIGSSVLGFQRRQR
jgi:hypothetical protein